MENETLNKEQDDHAKHPAVKKKKFKSNNIRVNDVFHELMDENRRLSKELLFANKCLEVLNKFKSHLNSIHIKYDSILSSEDKQEFNQLEEEFTSVINSHQTIEPNIDEYWKQKEQEFNNCIDIKPNIVHKKKRKREKQTIADPNRPKRAKPLPKDCEIPDPILEPDNPLLLRRDTYDESIQLHKCPNPYCDKALPTRHLLYNHFRRIHVFKKNVPCPVPGCGKLFKSPQFVREHHKLVHEDDRPFNCSVEGCGYSFKIKAHLKQHMLTHTDERPAKCPECGKSYKNEQQMNQHKKLVHSSEPAFECRIDDCKKMFKSYYHLTEHKKTEHNMKFKPKPIYECDWPGCDRKSKRKQDIDEHKRIHTGERPFICNWKGCDKKFTSAKGLRDHLNVHKKIKPYACDWPGCSYRCTFNGNLSKHMRVHQKNK